MAGLKEHAPPSPAFAHCAAVARLHSQLDFVPLPQGSKVAGHESIALHPDDASARGCREGNLVRVCNDRGACLAGVRIDASLRPGVVVMATGAWFDPDLEHDGAPGLRTC
jgi:biotin/methionine sulfoxide reductase